MQSQFGRYLILKKIAVGGMAEIFLARRVSLGEFSKFVVIKRLAPEYQGKRSFERLFLSEAHITARLSHPNIVQVHDIGQSDGAYFMAMEYIHGVSSAELMSKAAQLKRPVPLAVAIGVTLAVARALEYCGLALSYEGEPLDVLHHDVSPHNIQVRFDGEVKLLDFGVATQRQGDTSASRRGKFAYMSPEAYNRMPLDARSDLFSLGVVLYELSMGRRLFKGRTQEETRLRAEQCLVTPPREVHAKFPPELEAVILRALAKDREGRFLDLSELCAALEEVTRALKLDVRPQRISKYLQDLYGAEVGERTQQLQALAARAEAMRDDPLDELSTIAGPAEAPLDVSGALEGREGLAPQGTPEGREGLAEAPDSPLFEAERVEDEVRAEMSAEPTPPPPAASAPARPAPPTRVALPSEFTLMGQRERDWDERPTTAATPAPALAPAPAPAPRRGVPAAAALLLAAAAAAAGLFGGRALHAGAGGAPLSLEVRSHPEGASVLVNGVLLGKTPLEAPYETAADSIEVQVLAPGHEALRRVVRVAPGQRVSLDAQLAPQR